jgi:hypothetical protein
MVVLTVLAAACWLWLPRLAPLFVIRNSPWIELVMRASAASNGFGGARYANHPAWERIRYWKGDAVPGLLRCLRDSDPDVRMWAAFSFMFTVDERSRASLRALLSDPMKDIRIAALDGLCNQGDEIWYLDTLRSVIADQSMAGDIRAYAQTWIDQEKKNAENASSGSAP